MKKTLTGIALLLLLLTAIWFARNPILMGLANLYLKPGTITLQCIDFDVDSLNKLAVHKLCLSLPNADITLQQANWDLSEKSLNIDSVTVIHQQQRSASSDRLTQPLKWQIPDLPAININNIQLSSPLLKTPVNLSLEYHQPQLRLSGPVVLEAKLENNLLSGTLKWHPAELASLADLPANLEQNIGHNPVQTDWTFDGQTLDSQHQLSVESSVILAESDAEPPCTVQIEASGNLGLRADILSQQAMVDLSALPVSLFAQGCSRLLPESLTKWQPDKLILQIPEPVNLGPQSIAAPEINIRSESPLTAVLTLKDIASDFQQLSAAYRLRAENGSVQWQGEGNLKINDLTALKTNTLPDNLSFSATNHRLVIEQLRYNDITLSALQVHLNASYNPDQGLDTDISMTLDALTQRMFGGEKLQLKLSLSSADLMFLQGEMDITADKLTSEALQLAGLRHKNSFDYDGNILALEGISSAKLALVQGTEIKQPELNHQFHTALDLSQPATALDKSVSSHTFTLPSGFSAKLSQRQHQLDFRIPEQSVKLLNNLLQQQNPPLQAGQGKLSANLQYQSDSGQSTGNLTINDMEIAYGKYLAKGVNLILDGKQSSGKLQITPATLNIDSLQTGVDILAVSALIKSQESNVVIEELKGQLFDGQFKLDKLMLTDEPQRSLLTLNNLDMARILELQQETGIDVQGRVSGNIPLHIHNRQVEIRNGSLFNLDQGKLHITDNAAFAALKQSQPQLEPVLSLLQNLEFTELNSDVSMQPNGLLFLDMQIKGRNPDEKQDVNFNYTHEENIFTLLRALRLGEEIQDKLEQGINED
ncbi:intermembrane phospholipid transport protein YdbH family protein [Lacimicrobium alkaliphilum]|uniref:Dicarboxylate transport domain-containing protein n=1 Tax=Lacimicrobium alkaliphilum TaxID=1526571 RepID=A0ABQ1RM19_9ALTE|nr:YdbH domain-containing protein [Lacimicrobium alkaliphilum]GGD74402.1 hypothetical protein GCM10011357_31790 [Lacimicrobium alkaliphilum]